MADPTTTKTIRMSESMLEDIALIARHLSEELQINVTDADVVRMSVKKTIKQYREGEI